MQVAIFATGGDFNEKRKVSLGINPNARPTTRSQIVYGDYLYTVYDQGFMTCHNALTGEELYGKRRFSPRGSFTASPWAYDGKVFCLSEQGLTYVVQAGPEFKVLATNKLDELCIATPSVVDGKLLVRTLTKVYCITESKSGELTEARNASTSALSSNRDRGDGTQTNANGIVQTEHGPVRGVPSKDASVEVFKGIPYAAPPVGNLRWRVPGSLRRPGMTFASATNTGPNPSREKTGSAAGKVKIACTSMSGVQKTRRTTSVR